jgi:hypothetical protein
MVVAGVLMAMPAAAAAAPAPCWHVLIEDWADGQIDGHYPASCYRNGIANAPTDLRIYSTLEDDLQRALLTSTARHVPGTASRRTLATAGPRQTTTHSSSSQARLAALLIALGGTLAAVWLGAARIRRRRIHVADSLDR